MSGYLNITKPEYLHILRNRNKSVSPSISHNKLLKKVRYLSKQDLNHLLTIRGLVSNDSSLESIIDALFKDPHKKKQNKLIDDLHKYHHSKIHSKVLDDIYRHNHRIKQSKVLDDVYRYHHKQNLKNLKEQIYRNLQKRQNNQIINESKKIRTLNLLKLIKERVHHEVIMMRLKD